MSFTTLTNASISKYRSSQNIFMESISKSPRKIHVTTWNVRPRTDDKLTRLPILMGVTGLDVTCIQETRHTESQGEHAKYQDPRQPRKH